eukprot:1158781-Pelagomonas_calceolata.AAC.3
MGCVAWASLQVRDQLMDWVAEREMKIYQLFIASGGADTSKLDRFERRFQWYVRVRRAWHGCEPCYLLLDTCVASRFRNRLEERKAEWSIFPEQWRVPQVGGALRHIARSAPLPSSMEGSRENAA